MMKKLVLTYLLVFSSILKLSAQVDNTMYFMDRLPQSSWINPAQTPSCKFYIGGLIIPVFGQLPPPMMFALNTPIDYNDVIFHGEGAYSDSLITPLHPTANIDDFLKKLRKVNYISTEFQLDLLNFGFKTGKNGFFSFDLSERMFFDFGMPKSLFEFAAKGNDAVRDADFTGLGVNAMYYHQLALGYKHQFSKTFSAGLRAKLLIGVANVKTASSDLQLTTAEKTNYMKVTSNYEVSTNMPLEITFDEEGYVDDIDFLDITEESSYIKNYALTTGNYGFAMDFGVSKDITSSLSCYFSVEDLGLINWKTNAGTFGFYDDDSLNFNGVVVSNLDIEDFEDAFDLDSITDHFTEISYTEGAYKTYLPTKFYFGAKYLVAKRISFGALAKMELLPHKIRPSFTLSANFKPFKFTAATLSYSCLNGNYNNIGLGFTVHPGPIQWYFVSDNLIGAALFPTSARSLSVRMGCNLVFGCVDKTKNGSHNNKNRNASMLDNKKSKNKGVVPYSNKH